MAVTKRKMQFAALKIKALMAGTGASVIAFLLFGVPTALVKTPWFKRMIPATSADYTFLIINSVLLGAYIGLHFYKKHEHSKKCDWLAAGGAFANIFAIGCPICNALLIAVFGTTALMAYFEPYRPLLGFVSTIILAVAIYWRYTNTCKQCKK